MRYYTRDEAEAARLGMDGFVMEDRKVSSIVFGFPLCLCIF